MGLALWQVGVCGMNVSELSERGWRVLGARGWGELVKRRKLREWFVLGAVGGSVGGAAPGAARH